MVIASVHGAHRSLPQELDSIKLVTLSRREKAKRCVKTMVERVTIPVHYLDYGSDGKSIGSIIKSMSASK